MSRTETNHLEILEVAHRSPGLIALVALLCDRIQNGNSSKALEMLKAIGLSPRRSYKLIEAWPKVKNIQEVPDHLMGDFLANHAVWFVVRSSIDIKSQDWRALLLKATRAAK